MCSACRLSRRTAESMAMSKALKTLGFSFVGPTICYSLMQAAGMVDDHMRDCFCRQPGRRGVQERDGG